MSLCMDWYFCLSSGLNKEKPERMQQVKVCIYVFIQPLHHEQDLT